MDTAVQGSIDIYWLPLGAGGHVVRWNGRIYEALAAVRGHRRTQDLFHAALEVREEGDRFVIEMGPVWGLTSLNRDVVCEGPVVAKWLGRYRPFRYEVRSWLDGYIPDAAESVHSPQRLSDDPHQAADLLRLVPTVPPLTWGRDEIGCGDMWNSNSLVSWLLASTGQDMRAIEPPAGGRAPGWQAGLALAARGSRRSEAAALP